MVRFQIQLTDQQLKSLRHLPSTTGKSTFELVRDGVDLYLSGQRPATAGDRVERAIRVAGKFSSGYSTVSAEHDKHLAEAFEE